jgi:hypothetical protein
MTVLRERNGQALIRYDGYFEWWFNTKKMYEGVKLEEKNGKTQIYCFEFKGGYRECWLTEEFDRRVPKYNIV